MASALTQHQPTTDRKWAGVFALVSLAIGASLLFLPVHIVIALLIGMVITGYLVLNPDKCFWLVIFTIPFNERIRALPISFSPNDLLLLFCAGVVMLHIIFKSQAVNFRTKLDGWILALTGLFFLAGLFSESSRGLLGFFKFFEAVVIYYLTVYFVRTRQVSRAQILKLLIATAAFQAALGILQSLTGGFGATFLSNRGYLGYLGLGSSVVWHGKGTMEEFNTLGNYLTANVLLFLPLYWFIFRKKKWGAALGALLMLGLVVTYSRGSLLGLFAGLLYILWQIPQDRKRAALVTTAFVVFLVLPGVWFFANSPYVETVALDDRLRIWQVPIAAITSSSKAFWLGSGLNSYEIVAWPYIPANIPMQFYYHWFAHNFYLLTMVEIGLLGSLVFFGFLGWLLLNTWKKYRDSDRKADFNRIYSLSLGAALVSVFFVSIFDHSYGSPYFRIFLFLLLGLLYVHPVKLPRQRHQA